MGCPVRKVVRVGGGSAMMTELDRTAALVRGMVAAVRIPVTAKMRLGWDEDNLTAPHLARVLEDAGVAAVFVPGPPGGPGFRRGGCVAGTPAGVPGGRARPGNPSAPGAGGAAVRRGVGPSRPGGRFAP